MKEKKLTPWFPASVKPTQPGLYSVSCRSEDQSGNWYAWFGGSHWSPYWQRTRSFSPRMPRGDTGRNSDDFIKSWRGLAKEPK